ncbi:Rho termination factor N-terminal domain-containing protein [Rhodococcus sp. (in: high G+C Gram-positive bacteria)]|uniref:Rho termination factor N-terminal domain-containing protein n=1 Tax=Rhodococcus sp. TaxID=1831 RepID=UPI001A2F4312|nr:Rho termination factor N-terminal domain-containing protein [Rhodococcus sp. (in: high G+C Gram-positive bacteria)]MBJ7481555.1 hypothetical protein [Rhodococcus sp. (in: high G+C Gram-positive bacteria)]
MTDVTTPVEGFDGVVIGVQFKDGKGETDNAGALAYFRRHGYGVAGSDPVEPEGHSPADSLNDLSVPKLREYAKDKGIDLGDASKKADILAAIEKAASPAGLQEDADPAAAAQLEEWLEAEKRHNDAVGGLSE